VIRQAIRLGLFAVCVLLVTGLTANGQNRSVVPPEFSVPKPQPAGPIQPSEAAEEMEKARLKKANEERQAQLKRDTDKLLQLSNELKEYVDKTNENVLSVDVIKKADEIEKLAHSVKQKMSAK
jgi:hypothetical protein